MKENLGKGVHHRVKKEKTPQYVAFSLLAKQYMALVSLERGFLGNFRVLNEGWRDL